MSKWKHLIFVAILMCLGINLVGAGFIISMPVNAKACVFSGCNDMIGFEKAEPGSVSNSTTEEEVAMDGAKAIQANNVGTLLISDIDVDVPLYEASLYVDEETGDENTAQEIVDMENAAAILKAGSLDVIADHVEQDFARLHEVKPGCIAVIKKGDSKEKYVCTAAMEGKNTEEMLTDRNGTPITDLLDEGIVMYTCRDTWEDITLTLWKKETVS